MCCVCVCVCVSDSVHCAVEFFMLSLGDSQGLCSVNNCWNF